MQSNKNKYWDSFTYNKNYQNYARSLKKHSDTMACF